MSTTSIEWTQRPGTVGAVWNIVTGCNKVDRGCKHCYAEVMHKRLQAMGSPKYQRPFLDGAVTHQELLLEPQRWKRARTVFVNSMSDLFHESVPFSFLELAFMVMSEHRRHTYLILTKRPERALGFWYWMRGRHGQAWRPGPHVWLGTSVNDQPSARLRIPVLMSIDTPVRFVSYEPATGPVDLTNAGLDNAYSVATRYDGGRGIEWTDPGGAFIGLDWVIMGGESGNKATPMHPDWARAMRDACVRARVPFFFKQWGRWEPVDYRGLTAPSVGAGDDDVYFKTAIGKNEYTFSTPYRVQNMRKARKKSDNLLDGELWQQFPDVALPSGDKIT